MQIINTAKSTSIAKLDLILNNYSRYNIKSINQISVADSILDNFNTFKLYHAISHTIDPSIDFIIYLCSELHYHNIDQLNIFSLQKYFDEFYDKITLIESQLLYDYSDNYKIELY